VLRARATICNNLLPPRKESPMPHGYAVTIKQAKGDVTVKRFKRIFMMVTALGMVGVTLSACGWRHHHQHDPAERAQWMSEKVTEELDLTEAQQVKLEAVKNALLDAHQQRRAKREAMLDQLIAEINKPALEESVLLNMADEHHRTMVDEVAPAVLPSLVAFHASLTAEQKQTIVEKLNHFREHRKHKGS
jgi:Spy/CpxP family protein refolding chaperone